MPQQYEHYNDATVPLFGEDSRKVGLPCLAACGHCPVFRFARRAPPDK